MTEINIFRRASTGVASDWVTDWTSVSATLRRNYVGSWQLNLPGWVEWDSEEGVSVERDGEPLFSGCWTSTEHEFDGVSWSTQLQGDTDLARIAYRVVFPDPAETWEDQNTQTHYVQTSVDAETVLRRLVNLNAGPGALEPRRVSSLTLGAVAGVGTIISKQWRLSPLLDACRTAARLGGDLSFDIRSAVDGSYEFVVFEPRDRTAQVHIEPGTPGVDKITHELQAPTATVYELAGSGEGAARHFLSIVDDAAEALGWRQREMFVDRRDTADDVELANEAADLMVDHGPTTAVGAVITSSPGLAYGLDWRLGDRLSVHTPSGTKTPVVETVEYDYDVGGSESITASIGVARLLSQPEWLPVVIDKDKRLRQVEAGL